MGVSPEGQRLFDAIRKTTPVVWRGDSFVVMDCVRVSPPYTVATCAIVPAQQPPSSPQQQGQKKGGQPHAEAMLTRVRKLVEELAYKLKLHAPASAPASAQ